MVNLASDVILHVIVTNCKYLCSADLVAVNIIL